MDRRAYLTAVAATIGMAGCSGGDDGTDPSPTATTAPAPASPTSTEEATPTPTPTATPTETDTPTETTTTASPAEFEVVGLSLPGQVEAGESYQIEITVRNVGGQGGTWQGDLYARTRTGDRVREWSEPSTIEIFVPGGETKTWTSDPITIDQAGYSIEYRLGESGPITSIEVTGNTAPIIQDVNLVSEWMEYGDAIKNAISSATIGNSITIAWRYQYYVENSTLHVFEQCRIFGPDGNRVTMDQYEDNQIVSKNGWDVIEHALSFSTIDWDPGEYTAEVLLRDETGDGTSEAATVTFTLEEPSNS